MKVMQKKQIDYVAYVKNMWNFNISKKEKELYAKRIQALLSWRSFKQS